MMFYAIVNDETRDFGVSVKTGTDLCPSNGSNKHRKGEESQPEREERYKFHLFASYCLLE